LLHDTEYMDITVVDMGYNYENSGLTNVLKSSIDFNQQYAYGQ